MRMIVLVVGLMIAGSAAAASKDFQVYEGDNAVREGHGGTRITANGVDFWTTGTPPRVFKVLGVLSDTRPSSGRGSDYTRSSALAKRVKEAGGDAVIVWDSSTNNPGDFQMASGLTISGEQRTTRFYVIQYGRVSP